MSDLDDTHEPPDDPSVASAFDNLRAESQGLDAMAPLQRVQARGSRRAWAPALIGGGLVAILLVVVGIAVFSNSNDQPDQVATDTPTIQSDGSGGSNGAIAGTSWVLVEGSGPSGDVLIVDGWPITLTFDTDTIGGTAACNGYGGSYTLTANTLAIQNLSQTEIGCSSEVMQSESAYLAILPLVTEFNLDAGNLVLGGPGGDLVLRPDPASPAPIGAIADRIWELDLWEATAEGTGRAAQGPAWLRLSTEGSIQGHTGCRSLRGEYVVAGASIEFTSFGAEGSCAPDLRAQDNAVVTVLGDGFVATVADQELTATSQGNERLIFIEAEEPPSDPVPEPIPSEVLIGPTWVLLEGEGPEGEIFPSTDGDIISIVFGVDTATFGSDCERATSGWEVVGSDITWMLQDMTAEGCDNGFREAVVETTRIELFGSGSDLQLVLSGPGVDMLFEVGDDAGDAPETERDPLAVDEILDRPEAVEFTPVIGYLAATEGGWILCGGPTQDGPFPCLGSRWLTLLDYDPGWWGDITDNPVTMVVSPEEHGRWLVSPAEPEPGEVPDPSPDAFSVTVDEQVIVDAIVAAARDGAPIDPALFADQVALSLAGEVVLTRESDELADPASWVIDREEFRAHSGPFSVLDVIRSRFELSFVQVETEAFIGPHDHCAAPPAPLPDLPFTRQLVIQPTGIDSCLQWFAVDLLLTDAGRVSAINLDLWEP